MKTILSFLKPYRKRLLFISLIMIADVGGSLLVPTITANMINLAVSQADLSDILVQGIWMLGIALLSGGLTLLGSWLCARLSADFGRDLRVALYDKTLSFSTTDFETFGTASMITRTLNDINVLQQSLMNVLQLVLPVPVMCALGIFFSFSIHRNMGFLILGATFLVLAAALLIIRKAARIFELLQSFLDRMNVVLRENLTGVRVIRAFRKETHEIKRMRKSFEDYAISAIQANRLFAGLDCLATVVINLTIVAILYLGGNQIGTGSMKVGDITAVTEYAIWILFYVMMAQMVILLVPRAMTCMRRICAVLNHTPEIKDGTGQSGSGAGPEIFRFDHVSFRFADADENTLSDLSFSCEKGKTTAIIGGTGSGKSTIAKLLLRFHDVTAGQITLKGTDIRSLPQSELRSAISYIPQRAWLFSGTIEENLRYGNPDATREDLIRALKTAQADFVLDLPGGLKSHVSQGGTNFSGGQRQRLSIARALVKTADLYVFDDSFSALDFQTDAALRHALQEEITEAGLLIIAQRISTILHADQILVLNEGQIAGIGRHEELMETCPIYRDIAHSQMKGGN